MRRRIINSLQKYVNFRRVLTNAPKDGTSEFSSRTSESLTRSPVLPREAYKMRDSYCRFDCRGDYDDAPDENKSYSAAVSKLRLKETPKPCQMDERYAMRVWALHELAAPP